jgi:hypothetical protein
MKPLDMKSSDVSELKITKADEADAVRIFDAKAGRMPTDAETYELAMLKFIRDELAKGGNEDCQAARTVWRA